jgi:hypothetical protein
MLKKIEKHYERTPTLRHLAAASVLKLVLKIALMVTPTVALAFAASGRANEVDPSTTNNQQPTTNNQQPTTNKVKAGLEVAKIKGTAKKTFLHLALQPTEEDQEPPASACKFTDKPSITVISPIEGEVIRSNSGVLDIAIEVYVNPAIITATESLKLKIFLDCKLVASGGGSTFRLPNADRGEHGISERLHQGEREIGQSPQITFTLLRRSIIRR